jgi:integrase
MTMMPTHTPTLQDVIAAIEARQDLYVTRKRDLVAAIRWVSKTLCAPAETIKLDLRAAAARFDDAARIRPELSKKRIQNLRSDFAAAVHASGLTRILRTSAVPLTDEWAAHLVILKERHDKQLHSGLSRFARFCASLSVPPSEVNDETFSRYRVELETNSVVRRPRKTHTNAILCWNRACALPGWEGAPVAPLARGRIAQRVDLAMLPATFREDLDAYLDWCTCTSPLDDDARSKALRPATIISRRSSIHSAVDGAVRSGVEPHCIHSLASLVQEDVFKLVLRHFYKLADGKPNANTRAVAVALLAVAKEWVKVPGDELAKLKRLNSKLPSIPYGLTDANTQLLNRFNDPVLVHRLLALPEILWQQAVNRKTPQRSRLRLAQSALMIELLLCCPLRVSNLCRLEFSKHISFPAGSGGNALLHIDGSETKNGVAVDAELSTRFSQMARAYREKLVPEWCGRSFNGVFIDGAGRLKHVSTVNAHFRKAVARIGVSMSVHKMRHLAAKLILDQEPGAIYLVSQLLGHKSLKITQMFYAGLDTNRAVKHMGELIEKRRVELARRGGPKGRKS